MKNELIRNEDYTNEKFEEIKHIDENDVEFWYARELMIILEYKQWRRFENVIAKAKDTCKNSGISEIDHFANVGKMVYHIVITIFTCIFRFINYVVEPSPLNISKHIF